MSVSPIGGANYTIPITIPPGTKGVQPNISISYNSQGGNGIMGMGWNFSGISMISRVNKDFFNDGVVESVNLGSSDIFALDGNKLILASGTYGTNEATYATKIETFSKITSYNNAGGGLQWFKVVDKSGMTYEYGNSTNSKLALSPTTRSDDLVNCCWYLNKAYDTYGNYMEYQYTQDGNEVRLSKILYTGSGTALP
jgi:Salmonella virulence plasmid 65kDa B protein